MKLLEAFVKNKSSQNFWYIQIQINSNKEEVKSALSPVFSENAISKLSKNKFIGVNILQNKSTQMLVTIK